MKKTLNKKKIALASSALLLAATVAGGTLTLPVSAASYDNTYNVDVTKAFQEFDGWGLSLSWWATEIGDWTRTGSSGLSKREEIMEAIYGKSGLNLNIARYNVGGGDDPSHTHMTDDRNTPGWKGATKLGEDEEAPAGKTTFTGVTGGGEGVTYVPNDKYFFEDEEGNTLDWQDTPDWRQLWVLDWIQKNRTDDLLTEYYSNSPPYWLTRSGCSSGAADKSENLVNDAAHNQAFVDYLLDVYEYLVGQGFRLDNIQPFNESNSDYHYWSENGDQEGCHFSTNQQVAITKLLAQKMKERKIDAAYNWGDETNTTEAWHAYYGYKDKYNVSHQGGTTIDPDVVNGASRLTYHIYSYDNATAQRLYRAAQQHGQEIYMSEICWTEGSEYDPSAMATGFKYTQSILDTVKYCGVDGYVFWQGVEDMVGQMKSGTNYGLIQGVYYTQEEAATQGVDLAALGYNHQDFVLSKAYYMSGQYTKYINKGYTIIDIDDNGSMAAISPDGETLVVVKQNNSSNTDSFKLNLGGFKAGTVEKIVTDKNHNWAKSAISTDGSSIIDTVSASSVTTYVVHGTRTGGEGFYLDDSKAVKKSSIDAIQAAFAEDAKDEDTSKTYMYATYDVQGNDGGDYGYLGTTSTNQAAWMAVRFYGVGFGVTLPKKSDAGSASVWVDDPTGDPNKTIDLKSSNSVLRSIVYSDKDVANFEEGWHTVYVRQTSGWVNFDGIFIKKTADVGESGNSLAVTQASGLGGTVSFTYEKIGFMGYEIFAEYRTAGGSWIRSNESFADPVGSIDVGYASTVELRLAAVKGEDVQYSPAQVVNILEVKNGVLYFVDCGTASENELSAGAVLGMHQSTSDKAYGPDAITGLNWGYTNGIKTAYNATEDAMTSVMSLDKTGDSALTYKFTIPQAGTYQLALGFYAGTTDWGTRAVTVSVTGATVDAETNEVTLVGGSYNGWYATVETAAANTEITVSIAKVSGDSPMVSLIVITDSQTALPLYTSGASNYNSATVVEGTQVSIGADLISEVKKATATVYLSNGETAEIAANGAGVSYTVNSPNIVAGQQAQATFTSREYPGLEIYSLYTWHQEGAMILYYNIDCAYIDDGTPPDDAAGLIGSKQSTTHDQAYGKDPVKKDSWGYTSAAGDVSYENNKTNSWSVRGNVDNMTYKMTGFEPNEPLQIMTGGHLYKNWGVRAYDVICNGETVGNISFPGDDQDVASNHIYDTFTCTANASGELEVVYTSTSKDKDGKVLAPWVGYIKVWSTGDNIAKAPAITTDKTTVGRDGTVNLKNLEPGATVYVLDENGALLGNFEAEAANQTIAVIDYLPESSYTLHFIQAVAGDATTQRDISAELVVSVPGITYTIENEYVKDGEELIVKFLPCIEKGLTSFTVTPPGGVPYDLTEGFFFRAKTNGDYKVTLVANGVTSSQIVKIRHFAEFNAVYSTEDWTADDVTLTLAPETVDEIVSVIINGEQATANAEGKYVITATRNGSYTVKLVTKAGYEYEKEFVISNIDKGGPDIDLNFNFSVAAGISFDFSSLSASGGKLSVSLNGGAAEEVTDIGKLSLAQAGKYEFTYTNGAGQSVQAGVYYVTYGLKGANVAKVKKSSDGKITVSDKTNTVTAKLYRAGEEQEITSMRADKMGKYYLELANGSEKEIIVFNVDGNKSFDGSVIMIPGIAVGCAAIVAAVAVCTVVILKGRKKS